MAEYIEREALLAELKERHDYVMQDPEISKTMKWCEAVCFGRTKDILDATTAADVVEVVHGRWEYHDCVCTGEGLTAVYACSNCRFCIDEEVFEQLNATDFCNCCGARMDGADV